MDNPAGDFIKNYLEGDDVQMIVGIAVMSPEMLVSMIVVDYSRCSNEKVRDVYTRIIEDSWVKKDFNDGFDVVRVGPEQVRVTAKIQADVTIIGGGHENVLRAPAYYADVNGGKDPIDKFFELKEKKKLWIFHLRTMEGSYIYVLDHETGRVMHSEKRPPIGIFEQGE